MKNYIPKSLKVTKPTNNKLIKISIILILLITVSIIFFFSNNPKSTLILDEKVFKGKYEEEKNFIKIDGLKFFGYNKKNNPYSLTAKLAIKETKNINEIVLYKVKADIFFNDQSWVFLNTEKAVFDVKKKTLHTFSKVKGYYDDGSSFITPSLNYNFNTGLAKSEEGIVMFGKWGNIKSEKFTLNTIKNTYNFSGNASMNVR